MVDARRISPDEAALDEEDVLTAIYAAEGNVAEAADGLGVRSDRLRAFIRAKPALRAGMAEILDRGVDLAVAVLFEGLRDERWTNRFAAAKEFLRSEAAARRGFRTDGAAVSIQGGAEGPVVLKWLDPLGPKLIEGQALEKSEEE
jgi:hypothetical protein